MELRTVDLISYYPEYLRENKEYVAICDAENPEFNLLLERLEQVKQNILPGSANEEGIAKYEEWLGIPSNPYLPLEQRRNAVLAKLNETLPYTEIRLQRMLAAIIGWGHFKYERFGAFIKITLDQDGYFAIDPVIEMLERVLPLNLHYEVDYGITHDTKVKVAGVEEETVIIETDFNYDNQTATVYMGNPVENTVIIETEVDNG